MRLEVDIMSMRGRFLLDANICVTEKAIGIFGRSGSGKSSLLRAIAGLDRPDAGVIELDGETLFDSDRRIFVPPHRRRIGWASQSPHLFPHWSVKKNLRAGMPRHTKPCPYSEKQVIELTEIGALLDRAVPNLSGGEQQRVSLARTLLSYPRLLLMDEPLSALDSRLKARILPFLNRIHRELGIPFLYVSHDLSEILQLTDQLMLMEGGRIATYGRISDLVQHPEMLELIQDRDLNQIIGLQLGVVKNECKIFN